MHTLTAALFLPPRQMAAQAAASTPVDAQHARPLTPTWLGRLVQSQVAATHEPAHTKRSDEALDLDQRIRLVGEW